MRWELKLLNQNLTSKINGVRLACYLRLCEEDENLKPKWASEIAESPRKEGKRWRSGHVSVGIPSPLQTNKRSHP